MISKHRSNYIQEEKGYFIIHNELFDKYLSGDEYLIYSYIVRYSYAGTQPVYMSITQIQKRFHKSRAKIIAATKLLEKKRLIVRLSETHNRTSMYRLLPVDFEHLKSFDRFPSEPLPFQGGIVLSVPKDRTSVPEDRTSVPEDRTSVPHETVINKDKKYPKKDQRSTVHNNQGEEQMHGKEYNSKEVQNKLRNNEFSSRMNKNNIVSIKKNKDDKTTLARISYADTTKLLQIQKTNADRADESISESIRVASEMLNMKAEQEPEFALYMRVEVLMLGYNPKRFKKFAEWNPKAKDAMCKLIDEEMDAEKYVLWFLEKTDEKNFAFSWKMLVSPGWIDAYQQENDRRKLTKKRKKTLEELGVTRVIEI